MTFYLSDFIFRILKKKLDSQKMSKDSLRLNASSNDVTARDRSPVEQSFYESFLLQKQSNVDSLYAANVYHGKTYFSTVRNLKKERQFQLTEMNREIKKTEKKMADLKIEARKANSLRRKEYRPGTPANASRTVLKKFRSVDDKELRCLTLPPLVSVEDVRNRSSSFKEVPTSSTLQARDRLYPSNLTSYNLSKSCDNLSAPVEDETNAKITRELTSPSRLSTSPRKTAKKSQFFVTDMQFTDQTYKFDGSIERIGNEMASIPRLTKTKSSDDLLDAEWKDDNSTRTPVIKTWNTSSVSGDEFLQDDAESMQMKWVPRSVRVKSASNFPGH